MTLKPRTRKTYIPRRTRGTAAALWKASSDLLDVLKVMPTPKHRARLAKLSVQMCCDSTSECGAEPTDVASVDLSSAVSPAACSYRRAHGATVARLTPSQKVGCSSSFALRRSIDLDHARQPRIYFSPLRSSLVKGIWPRMALCKRRKLPCAALPHRPSTLANQANLFLHQKIEHSL